MGTKKAASDRAKKAAPGRAKKAASGRTRKGAQGKAEGAAQGKAKAAPGKAKATPGKAKAAPGRATVLPGKTEATRGGAKKAAPGGSKAAAGKAKAAPGKAKEGSARAKGEAGKGKAPGERAIFGKLAPAIKEAFSIAAQEVFFENIEQAVEDPRGLLDEGNIGLTYQGFHRGLITPEQMAEAFVALGPWLSPELLRSAFKRASPALTVGQFVGDLYDGILLVAAIDIAEGIVKRALKAPLPPRLAPLEQPIGALAARLAKAIEEGDSAEQNLDKLIFGGK